MFYFIKFLETINLSAKELENLTNMLFRQLLPVFKSLSKREMVKLYNREILNFINYKSTSQSFRMISTNIAARNSRLNFISIRQFHTRQFQKSSKEETSSDNKVTFMKNLFMLRIINTCIAAFVIYLIFFNKNPKNTKDYIFSPRISDVRFADVQGCDEVKKELQDVVAFLKNPNEFNRIGAHLPKGILLEGEPGVGKTLIAKAVAGESGVPFFSCSGSEFDEMFVGVGALRIRHLFSTARKNAPCVIFIDELDAVCGKRAISPMQPFANQTVNQILSEMDGFTTNGGVIVIGSTNRTEALDKAVLRPGRFDLKLNVYPPDYLGRRSLFELYLGKLRSVDRTSINLNMLAHSSIGYTGADIRNLVNQAAIICVLKGNTAVNQSHLDEAEAKLQLGGVRSKPLNDKANRLCAYHEAGHALVTYYTQSAKHKLKRVSILPRGHTGGHTSYVEEEEGMIHNKSALLARIDIAFGGRAAEEILNGTENISSGVFSDVEVATKTARYMVEKLTMSSEIGLMVFDEKVSDSVQQRIDAEIIKILDESYKRAKYLIENHSKEWHNLASYLLKYDSLSGDDVEAIFKGKKPYVELIWENNNKK